MQPNARTRRPEWKWLFATLLLISMGIALRFAWLGYWMILPFTVIELSALCLVLYMLYNKNNYVERILINEKELVIQHLAKNADQQWQFPLAWSKVNLEAPRHHWYPHRLLLGSSGNWVEVGSCLTDEERQSLATAIREQIDQVRSEGMYRA